MIMFCYQCEQTAKGAGCQTVGVCGKPGDVAALQDLLLYSLKGLAQRALAAKEAGVNLNQVHQFITEGLFATVTNVGFDPEQFRGLIHRSVELRDAFKPQVLAAQGSWKNLEGPAAFQPAPDLPGLIQQGESAGLQSFPNIDPNIHSLQQLMIYGLKGLAAYADHALILGQTDEVVFNYMLTALADTLNPKLGMEDWIARVLKCGEVNLRAMELLDAGNTGTYGHPVPTEVPLGAKKGKAILVSGHDLKDLAELLKQTQGMGINIYTHGEMLPTHGYPQLKAYPHFHGHYGTAWQNQGREFAEFPGAIVITTNCVQKPRDSYHDNLFTSGLVSWPGIPHIQNQNFKAAIERALALPGFPADVNAGSVMVGFGRNAVLSVAGKVVEAVKQKAIRHFFLVGGCDGAKPGRSYYTEFVEKVPDDCVVLTLACGKFRFFDKKLGEIQGIPRLLDVGQCNDAYSAIQIAVALSQAFGVRVNELPLSMVLSWYEQKAVAILLTLLHLGIKGIRLGPSLPAFITPPVLDYLMKTYDLKAITTPDEDLQSILKV
jgi:hydroxylamine reductase